MSKKYTICADVIARYDSTRFVIIKRLADGGKLALPGGKQDPGEMLSRTAVRELHEETGLTFVFGSVMGTYPDPARDPRNFVSTIFVGDAYGEPVGEAGKTEVLLLAKEEILARAGDFAFDHFDILQDYFQLVEDNDNL